MVILGVVILKGGYSGVGYPRGWLRVVFLGLVILKGGRGWLS